MIIRTASRAPLTTKAQTTFWWMTFWTGEDARVILSSHSLPTPASLCFLRPAHKGVILFRGGGWAECGLDPPPVIWAPALGLWIFSARLHDGEDKKGNDSDGKGTTQSSGRQETLQPFWVGRERGAWGPGKFSARLGSPQPENNFRLSAWQSRRYPQQRKIRDRQPIRKPSRQRQYLIHGNLFLWKQEENESLSRSFSRLRHEQRCGGGLPVSPFAGKRQPAERKQQQRYNDLHRNFDPDNCFI